MDDKQPTAADRSFPTGADQMGRTTRLVSIQTKVHRTGDENAYTPDTKLYVLLAIQTEEVDAQFPAPIVDVLALTYEQAMDLCGDLAVACTSIRNLEASGQGAAWHGVRSTLLEAQQRGALPKPPVDTWVGKVGIET